jgi:CheY-like chemotaxis protein
MRTAAQGSYELIFMDAQMPEINGLLNSEKFSQKISNKIAKNA